MEAPFPHLQIGNGIKTQVSESTYGTEREQTYSLESSHEEPRAHMQEGQQLKRCAPSRKAPGYALAKSAPTHSALWRCWTGTVNMRVAGNPHRHNIFIMISALELSAKIILKASLKSTFASKHRHPHSVEH